MPPASPSCSATETAAGTFVTAPLGFGGWVNTGPTLLMPSNLSGLLDISASGAPLTLRIFSANSHDANAGAVDNVVDYHNFMATINPVPEPGTIGLSRWLSPSRRCSA